MKKLLIASWLAVAGCCAWADDRPSDFAYGIPLDADGREALYEVALPAAVYRGVARADLGDVRVFNGAGDGVPYAWRPRRAAGPEAVTLITLTLFPLKVEAGTGVEGLSIRVRPGPDGRSRVDVLSQSGGRNGREMRTAGYFLDLTALAQPLRALELDWRRPPDGFAGKLRVDASDDLGSWRTLVAAAPLVSLEIAGQRLLQRRIELPRKKVKYLRLSWADAGRSALPELTGARGELVEQAPEAAREWAVAATRAGEKPGEYLFDLRGHYPLDRVRLNLPEANTVARVELLARGGADQPWRSVAAGVVYRLRRGAGEVTSPDMAFRPTSDRYWLVRVDPRGGGIGSGALGLEAGWVPHTLVFAARGEPPFQLAYGRYGARPGGHSMKTLVPGYDDNAGAQRSVNVATARALEQRELGGRDRLRESIDWKRWSLWAALLLGVVVLGAMAWRLARQLDSGRNAPAAKAAADPGEPQR